MHGRDWIGRGLLTLALAGTPGFQVTADWSFGHITNPDWPPHAKYHLIVYHLTLILFTAAAVYACWARWPRPDASVSLACFTLVAGWVPYYLAAAFPQGSPYATPDLARHPIPVQMIVGAVLVVVGVGGSLLARPRARSQGRVVS